MLRVIAYFGESFPEYISDTKVFFQAGPMTAGISSDPQSSDSSNRYLLLRMADCFAADRHLNQYIKNYTNAYHGSHQAGTKRTMFNNLHDLLRSEIADARKRGDAKELARLQAMASMVQAISKGDIT